MNEQINILEINRLKLKEDYLKPLEEGRQVLWSKGHEALYTEWKLTRADVARMSLDEKTQSLMQFMQEKVEEKVKRLIENKPDAAEEKTDLLHLASRGQILLGSNDGESFDLLITPKDLKTTQIGAITILSPILGEDHLEQVMQKQSALHLVNTLSEHYRIQTVNMKGSTLMIQVEHPEGFDTIRVELTENPNEAFTLHFQKEGTKGDIEEKTISIDGLDEAFGLMHANMGMEKHSALLKQMEEEENMRREISAKSSGMAGLSAELAFRKDDMNHNMKTGLAMAWALDESQKHEQEQSFVRGPKLNLYHNVMASKAELNARRKQEAAIDEEPSEEQVWENFRKDQEVSEETEKEIQRKIFEQRKAQESQKQQKKSGAMQLAKQVGVGGLVGAGFLGGLGGSSIFLTIFN